MISRVVSGVVALLATSLLGGCATAATKADASKKQVDVAYQQFILSEDGTKPYNLTFLPQLAQQCGARIQPKVRAGGVAILGNILVNVISEVASAVTKELQKLVNAKVAEYSTDISGKGTRVSFYSPDLWWSTSTDGSRQYSCFLIVVNTCSASSVENPKGVCRYTKGDQARVFIIGQYKLTAEDLQARPLYVRVRGFDAKRNSSEKQVSIAATLKFQSIWWDGHEGHTEAPTTINVFSQKFTPTIGAIDDPGITITPLQDPKDPTKVIFKDWSTVPLLPRPPRSPGSDGTLTVTPEMAETNAPPEGLKLISKVLGGNTTQISNALDSALKSLCGKACPSQTNSSK